MSKAKMMGKIFGIALVFAMIGSMLEGLPVAVNAGTADGSNKPN